MLSIPKTDKAKASQMVKWYAGQMGFDLVGITSADPFEADEKVAIDRLNEGLMDGLPWFHEGRIRRGTRPQEILPGARSIISLAMSYLSEDIPEKPKSHAGRVARYAMGKDYHGVMEKRLKSFVKGLSEHIGSDIKAKVYVDTGPMLDRAVAERSGIGWYGKNTNILTTTHGSWVFLGQVITDLELDIDEQSKKTCGNCTLCIDQCPTGAIVSPYVLDNKRCISYLTIECRGPIPRELRPLMGDWVFGCDICQDVCPVNRKAASTSEPAFQIGEHGFSSLDLIPLLRITDKEFLEKFAGTPIRRAKRIGLVRNVCIALGNMGDKAAVPALLEVLFNAESLLRGHSAWALGRIGGEEAKTGLNLAFDLEVDTWAAEEMQLAIEQLS